MTHIYDPNSNHIEILEPTNSEELKTVSDNEDNPGQDRLGAILRDMANMYTAAFEPYKPTPKLETQTQRRVK